MTLLNTLPSIAINRGDQQENMDFEAYAKSKRLYLGKHPYSSYVADETRLAWNAWMHRAEQNISNQGLEQERAMFEQFAIQQNMNIGKFLFSLWIYGTQTTAAAWEAWSQRAIADAEEMTA